MSLRGRVLRRKYSEWTLEPKSIQSQRAQLSLLLKAFHLFPSASISGSMVYLRSELQSSGEFVGSFPYPDIYPENVSDNLPIGSTEWTLMRPLWLYSGIGYGSGASYYIGYIVVSTSGSTPTVKSSGVVYCEIAKSDQACLETFIPTVTGGLMSFAGVSQEEVGGAATPVFRGSGPISFSGSDLCYVSMAFCQEPCPLNNSAASLSYYVAPEAVNKPYSVYLEFVHMDHS